MKEKHKNTFCVVQVSRFGDLLQTYQVAKAFKKAHQQIKLILVCRSQFGRPLSFLLEETFDEIHYLDFYHDFTTSKNLNELGHKVQLFIDNINSYVSFIFFNL